MTTPLQHLGLVVRDQRRSLRFYATYFGFDEARARRYPDGTVIVRNPQGLTWPCTQAIPPISFQPSCTSGSSSPTLTPWGRCWPGWTPMACRSRSTGTSRAMWRSSAWTLTAGGWRPTGNRSGRPAAWDERRAALVVGASFSHPCPGWRDWPDGAGVGPALQRPCLVICGVAVGQRRRQLAVGVGLGQEVLGLLLDRGDGVGAGHPAQRRLVLACQLDQRVG
jgi:hypothetical protein